MLRICVFDSVVPWHYALVTPSKLVTEGSSTLLHTIIRLATACLLCVVLALCAGMALADSQNPTRPRMAPAVASAWLQHRSFEISFAGQWFCCCKLTQMEHSA